VLTVTVAMLSEPLANAAGFALSVSVEAPPVLPPADTLSHGALELAVQASVPPKLSRRVGVRVTAVPVFLVGHSMGGYLNVLAALRRPELVRGLVLLDSPLLGGLAGQVMRLGKATGAIRRFSPGHVSQRRRQHWPDAEAAYAHFAAKPAFARWAPGVLRDYIASGVQPQEAGHGLAFRREVETLIYNTLPHDLTARLRRRPLACPMAFVGGTQSVEVRQVGMRATERWTHGRVSWVEGSHLFPLEQPAATAAQVLHWLQVFGAAGTR
jgi:pimeloyl-ACP methyl ester carboxylesterase